MGSPRSIPVSSGDGEFDLHLWAPDRNRPGPALVLLQEIFGVSAYIESVAQKLAAAGYLVGAPDLFWKLERNYRSDHDEAGLQQSLGKVQEFDFEGGVHDAARAEAALSDLAECDGRVGVLGICLGGAVGHVLAAQSDPDVLVSFYGSAVPSTTGLFEQITCPALYLFGGQATYIPRDQVAVVEAAADRFENITVRVWEEAGHAFHNQEAPMFHHADAAAEAWDAALDFLHTHLPVE